MAIAVSPGMKTKIATLLFKTVGRRLALAFGLLIGFAATQGTLSIYYLRAFSASVAQMYDNDLLGIRDLDRARSHIDRIQFALAEHLAAVDDAHMRAIADNIQIDRRAVFDWIKAVKSKPQTAVKQKLISNIDTAARAYIQGIETRVLPLSEQGQKAAAFGEVQRVANNELRNVSDLLDDLGDYDANAAETRREYATADYRTAIGVLAAIGAATLLFGVSVAFFVTRSVTRPLHQAASIAHRVASGDLTSEIEAHGDDETAQLLGALKAMNENLARIVRDVHVGATTINSAAQKIDDGNRNLSQRTEEQASSLEETAASMEELTATVKQNADSSRRASDLTAAAQATALRGAELMGDMTRTMNLIDTSAHKITQITKLIDDIAFQTNILALNAAVEAARAGDQGRGFAVVASEVRNLAMRSANAAREIKTLIDDSVATVGAGKHLVDRTGGNMGEIVSGIKQVNEFVGEIAAASLEQSSGLEQVNQAIAQLDDITQKNAELVQSATAATHSLHSQAQTLEDAVRVFKVRTPEAKPSGPSTDKPSLRGARLAFGS